ncbi:MAG: hypothetical protein HN348_04275 [Proteobacteria bacterium]|nr:hypothetical protein [Pseudomonadota bacterium]
MDPLEGEGPPRHLVSVEEPFVQTALPSVDLLFIVDNTASMAQEQQALAEEFSTLTASLAEENINWQLGVTTMDVSNENAGSLHGSPYVLTANLDDVDTLFSAVVQVGVDSVAPEAGLAAAAVALGLVDAEEANAGFRRPNASLHLVFVSDADDQSDSWLGADPVDAFLAILEDEETQTGLPARASALVGDVPSGCVSDNGTAESGERYVAIAEATDGAVASICAADFFDLLESVGDASITYQSEFELRATPVGGSLQVEIDSTRVSNWEYTGHSVLFSEPPAAGALIVAKYLIEIAEGPEDD